MKAIWSCGSFKKRDKSESIFTKRAKRVIHSFIYKEQKCDSLFFVKKWGIRTKNQRMNSQPCSVDIVTQFLNFLNEKNDQVRKTVCECSTGAQVRSCRQKNNGRTACDTVPLTTLIITTFVVLSSTLVDYINPTYPPVLMYCIILIS